MDIERTKVFIGETHSNIEGWFFRLTNQRF